MQPPPSRDRSPTMPSPTTPSPTTPSPHATSTSLSSLPLRRRLRPSTRASAPSLPPELWARVFAHLSAPRDLCAAACVCAAWRDELGSARAAALWRRVWDARAGKQSADVGEPPLGNWRAMVAASALLGAERAEVGRVVVADKGKKGGGGDGAVVVAAAGRSLGEMGKARCVQAFEGGAVLVGFEGGLGLLRRGTPQVFKTREQVEEGRQKGKRGSASPGEVLDVESSKLLGGVLMFAKVAGDGVRTATVIAATTTRLLVAIQVNLGEPPEVNEPAEKGELQGVAGSRVEGESLGARLRRARLNARKGRRTERPLRWTILDNFEMTNGSLISLFVSQNRRFALAGFSNGHIRVVNVADKQLVHVLSMRESPDIIVASDRWVVASNFTRPCPTCWDLVDGRAMHRWERSSVGWEEVTSIVGIVPAPSNDCFAVWDGKACIRILDVKTGRFRREVEAKGLVTASTTRNVQAEAEVGVAAPHAGPCKIVLGDNGTTVVVAASNRVLVTSIGRGSGATRALSMRQLEGARRSLVALSTDNRLVVTAEGDVFGNLASRFTSGVPSKMSKPPRVCVWDAHSGKLRREITGFGCISDLSVAGNTIAVVARSGKTPNFSTEEHVLPRGEALVFRIDTKSASLG